ncbi:nuclear transport factor 2 family protein [Nonomuraea antri]|uniref:nuclear transport factor 2 family protein n=1 Tax=Nonomuraea antri TaxID=2730852 RepID=UPI001C2C48E6|nr:nuclear transport factor 2 family protein [Nonomuraea antri]
MSTIEKIVTGYHAAMLAKSADALADLYAEDAEHEFPFGGMPAYQGREQVRAGYRAAWDASPGRVAEVRRVAVHTGDDPEVVVVEQETDVVVGDRRITVPGVIVLRIKDGVIVHNRDYLDVSAVARVLTSDQDAGEGGR